MGCIFYSVLRQLYTDGMDEMGWMDEMILMDGWNGMRLMDEMGLMEWDDIDG